MTHELPLPQRMFQMITGFWVTQALGTFAELGFADHLAHGPETARTLATRAGTDPDATYRLLRGLASVGVLVQDSTRFQLTPLGATLRIDAPGSMRDMARTMAVAPHWLPWGNLLEAVRTGSRQTGATLGTELFAYYDAHPDVREAFFGAMHGLSMLVAAEAPKVYDASAHRELCDVGGSAGTLAAGFLRTNPQLTGTVFDRPEVVPMATQAIAEAGLADRCRAVGGDFFVDVPAADLYVVKHVLHDWSDDQCRTLLGHIARRAKPGARVLVIEMVIPEDGTPSAAPLMDLNMLVLLPGRERTAGQYGELLAAAGLRLVDVRPTHSPMQVVVAEKV
jgi:hypothetical protein